MTPEEKAIELVTVIYLDKGFTENSLKMAVEEASICANEFLSWFNQHEDTTPLSHYLYWTEVLEYLYPFPISKYIRDYTKDPLKTN